MRLKNLYPEARRYLDCYSIREVTRRLPELLAYGEPIVVSHTRCGGPWVLVPAAQYDTMLAAWAGLNAEIERRRQQAEPLPPL